MVQSEGLREEEALPPLPPPPLLAATDPKRYYRLKVPTEYSVIVNG